MLVCAVLALAQLTHAQQEAKLDDGLDDMLTPKDNEACGYASCLPVKPGWLNVHIVPQTHSELGHVFNFDQHFTGEDKPHVQNVVNMKNILDSVLTQLWDSNRRKFTLSDTAYLFHWWNNRHPSVHRMMYELVRQGRLTVVGGGLSISDEASTSYHAIIDQYTYSLRKLNDTFRACARPLVAWAADVYGHSREFTSLMAQMGFDALFINPISYDEEAARMRRKALEFVWRGSDDLGAASDMFTHSLFDGYWSPPGFCFSKLCSDPLLVTSNRVFTNIRERINKFIEAVLYRQAPNYETRNIMVIMGHRKAYFDADVWFSNIEKLIAYTNWWAHQQNLNVTLFYSNPPCYLAAVHEEDVSVMLYPVPLLPSPLNPVVWTLHLEADWVIASTNKDIGLSPIESARPNRFSPELETKQDDFFPYVHDKDSYTVGMFTSRPNLKYITREAHVYLQIAKQIQVSANMKEYAAMFDDFNWVMGVVQDHSIATGVLRIPVKQYYVQRIDNAITKSTQVISRGLSKLRQSPDDVWYQRCLFNISSCEATRFIKHSIQVYNPLGWPVTMPVRLPVYIKNSQFRVYDNKGTEIKSETIKIPDGILTIKGRSVSDHEVVFIATNIPPVGFRSYYVEAQLSRAKRNIIKRVKMAKINNYLMNMPVEDEYEESEYIENTTSQNLNDDHENAKNYKIRKVKRTEMKVLGSNFIPFPTEPPFAYPNVRHTKSISNVRKTIAPVVFRDKVNKKKERNIQAVSEQSESMKLTESTTEEEMIMLPMLRDFVNKQNLYRKLDFVDSDSDSGFNLNALDIDDTISTTQMVELESINLTHDSESRRSGAKEPIPQHITESDEMTPINDTTAESDLKVLNSLPFKPDIKIVVRDEYTEPAITIPTKGTATAFHMSIPIGNRPTESNIIPLIPTTIELDTVVPLRSSIESNMQVPTEEGSTPTEEPEVTLQNILRSDLKTAFKNLNDRLSFRHESNIRGRTTDGIALDSEQSSIVPIAGWVPETIYDKETDIRAPTRLEPEIIVPKRVNPDIIVPKRVHTDIKVPYAVDPDIKVRDRLEDLTEESGIEVPYQPSAIRVRNRFEPDIVPNRRGFHRVDFDKIIPNNTASDRMELNIGESATDESDIRVRTEADIRVRDTDEFDIRVPPRLKPRNRVSVTNGRTGNKQTFQTYSNATVLESVGTTTSEAVLLTTITESQSADTESATKVSTAPTVTLSSYWYLPKNTKSVLLMSDKRKSVTTPNYPTLDKLESSQARSTLSFLLTRSTMKSPHKISVTTSRPIRTTRKRLSLKRTTTNRILKSETKTYISSATNSKRVMLRLSSTPTTEVSSFTGTEEDEDDEEDLTTTTESAEQLKTMPNELPELNVRLTRTNVTFTTPERSSKNTQNLRKLTLEDMKSSFDSDLLIDTDHIVGSEFTFDKDSKSEETKQERTSTTKPTKQNILEEDKAPSTMLETTTDQTTEIDDSVSSSTINIHARRFGDTTESETATSTDKYFRSDSQDEFIGNKYVRVNLNKNRRVASVALSNGVQINLAIKIVHYISDDPDRYEIKSVPRRTIKPPGAYIFRPIEPHVANLDDAYDIEVTKTDLVEEAHIPYSDWAFVTLRVYVDSPIIEVHWLIGPIPAKDSLGKDVFIRYTTDLDNDSAFYTDSNGRQTIKRIKGTRATYEPVDLDPITGNLYPVTSKIYIKDANKNIRFSVFNDRCQAGGALLDGTIDLMVHRRILTDDIGFGAYLNETDQDGDGIVATGVHYLYISKADKNRIFEKKFAKQIANAPRVLASDPMVYRDDMRERFYQSQNEFSALTDKLPFGVHLLTLERLSPDELLVRLENYLEKSDAKNSGVKYVAMRNMFTDIRVLWLRETTLAANMFKDQWSPTKWKVKNKFLRSFNENYGSGNETYEEDNRDDGTDDIGGRGIRLAPQEIRTFIVKYEYTRNFAKYSNH